MTEKRFKIHSMIQGMDIGETMDLEVCEELIKKYGSSADIDLLITNNGNDMTYREVVDLLNGFFDENEQLKKDCTVLIYHNQEYRKENEQLKHTIQKYYNTTNNEGKQLLSDLVDLFELDKIDTSWFDKGDEE